MVMCKGMMKRYPLWQSVVQVQLLLQHGSARTPHPQQAAHLPEVPLSIKVAMQMQLSTIKDLQQVRRPVISLHTRRLLLSHLPRTEVNLSEYRQAL